MAYKTVTQILKAGASAQLTIDSPESVIWTNSPSLRRGMHLFSAKDSTEFTVEEHMLSSALYELHDVVSWIRLAL